MTEDVNYPDIDVDITYMRMDRPHNLSLPVIRNDCHYKKILLDANTYLDYYRAVGEPYFWWERIAWDKKLLEAHLQSDNIVIYCFEENNGNFIGYAECDYTRSKLGYSQLAYFGITQENFGKGYGKYFLQSMIYQLFNDCPKGTYINYITVNSCNMDHPHAIPNYLKNGFFVTHHEYITIEDPRCKGYIPYHIKNPTRPII